MKDKLIKILKNPGYIFIALSRLGFFKKMNDEKYLCIVYKIRTGKTLNLENPKTFNEKLQWLKLYDRKIEYTTMVDKYAVKQYVADKIGENHIIPTLGVWDKFEDIDFDKLPNNFVLKCTHDSGGLVICRDKSKLDMNAAKEAFSEYLTNASLDSRQIYFVNQIVEYIVHNGMMKDLSVLQESPFTDRGSVVEIFTDLNVWMGIRKVIDMINANAVA